MIDFDFILYRVCILHHLSNVRQLKKNKLKKVQSSILSLLFFVESSLLLLWAWAEFSLFLSSQMKELGHAFHGPVLYSDFTTSSFYAK
jgi:hypothetical protein